MTQWQKMFNLVSANSQLLVENCPKNYRQLCLKRWLVANGITMVLQYLGLLLGTLLLPPSLLWFSAGVAVALLFLRGYKVLPGIYLGSFAAYHWAGSGLALTFFYAAIHSLQALVLVGLCHKINCYSLIFYRRWAWLKVVALSAMVTAIASFILAYSFVWQLNIATLHLWRDWWLADFAGLLIFSVALTTWDAYVPQMSRLNILPVTIDFGLLFILVIIFSLSHTVMVAGLLALAILFILLRIICKYHWPGSVMGCFLLGLLLSLAAVINAPLFQHLGSARLFSQIAMLLLVILGLAWLLE